MSLKSFNGEGFTSYFDVHQQLVNDDSKEKELLENSIITPDGDSYNLVPDQAFASLLNSKLEIEVADKIYRVTRFGTYIIDQAQYDVATAMIDSLYKSNTRLSQTRKFSFETETDRPDYYQAAPGILRLDTYKAFETGAIKEAKAVKAVSKSTLNNQVAPNLVNPGTIPPGNIVYTDYTNDKVFNYWDSKKRMRANWSEYNWASALFLAVEVTTQKKGWTGIWRELNAWETNIINNGVVMDRVPDYSSPLAYDIPAGYAVGVPYYFMTPSVVNAATSTTANAVGVRRADGRVVYTFSYAYVENNSTPTLGYALISASPGASHKPAYTSMNVGLYVNLDNIWRGIEYHR